MTVTNSANYNPTFPIPSADSDPFEPAMLETGLSALDDHNHDTNKGLPVARIASGATVGSGASTAAGGLGYASSKLTVGDGSASHNVATEDQTQTLSNKTLASPTFSGTASGNGTIPGAMLTATSVTPDKVGAGWGASVYNTANEAIANITTTALTFNTSRKDTNSFYSGGAPSRLTATNAGWYAISGAVQFAGSSGGSQRGASIRLNGATTIASTLVQPASTNATNVSVSRVYYLAANDYVELIVFQDSGGNLNVNAAGNYSPEFSIAFMSA